MIGEIFAGLLAVVCIVIGFIFAVWGYYIDKDSASPPEVSGCLNLMLLWLPLVIISVYIATVK